MHKAPRIALINLPKVFESLEIDETTQALNDALPQTQCTLCGHLQGCLPYAKAVRDGIDATNLCVPGGQEVADALAAIMGVEPLPAPPTPAPVTAIIDPLGCIGCTKCLPACPVDAILGTGKHMHTIIQDYCTGCGLCVDACPVDCINLKAVPAVPDTPSQRAKRYFAHLTRLEKDAQKAPIVNAVVSACANASATTISEHDALNVLARIRAKKKR